MTINRYAKRRDANEKVIFDALSSIPFLRVMRQDWIDLVVQNTSTGATYLLEVKTEHGRLTKKQEALIDDGWRIHVVTTIKEALDAVGVWQA